MQVQVIVAAWAAASVFVIWVGLARTWLRRRDEALQRRLQTEAQKAYFDRPWTEPPPA